MTLHLARLTFYVACVALALSLVPYVNRWVHGDADLLLWEEYRAFMQSCMGDGTSYAECRVIWRMTQREGLMP